MFIFARPILVKGLALACCVAAVGCGQRGALYLPADPAAAQRATLPEALNPMADKPSPAPLPTAKPSTQP